MSCSQHRLQWHGTSQLKEVHNASPNSHSDGLHTGSEEDIHSNRDTLGKWDLYARSRSWADSREVPVVSPVDGCKGAHVRKIEVHKHRLSQDHAMLLQPCTGG